MKKIIICLSVLSLLFLGLPEAKAEDASMEILESMEELSAGDLGIKEPTILPGSILYPVKKVFEKIKEALTFREDSIIKLNLQLANQRLLEARKLLKLGKYDLALQTLENYNARMEKVRERIEILGGETEKISGSKKAKIQEKNELFTENFFKHIQVLEEVGDNIENKKAQEAISSVIERSEETMAQKIEEMGEGDSQKTEEVLEKILNNLPGDEIGKIIYLQILREVKKDISGQFQGVIDKVESSRIQKITEFIEQNKLSSEEQQNILENLNNKFDSLKDTMSDLQYKIMNDLPQATRNTYEQIKQHIQENSEPKDGSFNILQ